MLGLVPLILPGTHLDRKTEVNKMVMEHDVDLVAPWTGDLVDGVVVRALTRSLRQLGVKLLEEFDELPFVRPQFHEPVARRSSAVGVLLDLTLEGEL